MKILTATDLKVINDFNKWWKRPDRKASEYSYMRFILLHYKIQKPDDVKKIYKYIELAKAIRDENSFKNRSGIDKAI